MNLALVLLDVDPSIVKPGWTALLVTVFIGAALALLYFSLRRQVGKISPELPYADDVAEGEQPVEPTAPTADITGKSSGVDSKS